MAKRTVGVLRTVEVYSVLKKNRLLTIVDEMDHTLYRM